MDYIKVFLLSATPIIELRGGFPLGIILGLSRWEALIVSVLGNMVIILPWLWALSRIEKIAIKNKAIHSLYLRLQKKAEKKKAGFKKYGKYVLFLFVAVPLPTTGAWTACVAARLFRISIQDSFFIISAGVVTSGIIMLMAKILTFRGLDFLYR